MHEKTVSLVENIDTKQWDALEYSDKSSKYKNEYQEFLNKFK